MSNDFNSLTGTAAAAMMYWWPGISSRHYFIISRNHIYACHMSIDLAAKFTILCSLSNFTLFSDLFPETEIEVLP